MSLLSVDTVIMSRCWTELYTDLSCRPAGVHSTYSCKQQGRTLVPPIQTPSPGEPLLKETEQEFLITRLIQRIEDLHISNGKASAARSSVVHLAHDPTICRGLPQSAKVQSHHLNNQIRMLTHRWKRLGVQHPAIRKRDENMFEHNKWKSQNAVKNDCALKITAIQTSPTVTPSERKQENEERMKPSVCSSAKSSGVKVSDTDSLSNTAMSLDLSFDDSDLSDQEKVSVQVSKWATPVELDLKPESIDKDLDPSSSAEVEEFTYADVLPVPLKDMDLTISSTEYSESQKNLFGSDPCLAPLVTRLLELERLQAASVQKERAKSVRSRPPTANTGARNGTRLRNCDLQGCKLGISVDAELNSVTSSLSKLALCPNPLCRYGNNICPLTKSGRGSRGVCLCKTSPKRPQTVSGKFNRTENVVPVFSVSVSPKPTILNRTKRLKSTKKSAPKPRREDSTSAKKMVSVPSRPKIFK